MRVPSFHSMCPVTFFVCGSSTAPGVVGATIEFGKLSESRKTGSIVTHRSYIPLPSGSVPALSVQALPLMRGWHAIAHAAGSSAPPVRLLKVVCNLDHLPKIHACGKFAFVDAAYGA